MSITTPDNEFSFPLPASAAALPRPPRGSWPPALADRAWPAADRRHRRGGLRPARPARPVAAQPHDPGDLHRHRLPQPRPHPRGGQGRRGVRAAPHPALRHRPARPAIDRPAGDRGGRGRTRRDRRHPARHLPVHHLGRPPARRRRQAHPVDRRRHLDLRRLRRDRHQHRHRRHRRGRGLRGRLRHRLRLDRHVLLSAAGGRAAPRPARLRPVGRQLDPRDRPGGGRGLPGRHPGRRFRHHRQAHPRDDAGPGCDLRSACCCAAAAAANPAPRCPPPGSWSASSR